MAFETAEQYLAECEPAALHCLVVGVRLAGMSGLDLQQQLLAQGRTHPLMFLTEWDNARGAILALKRGASDYLIKPQKPHEVIRRVMRNLRKHKRHLKRQTRYERHHRRIARLTHREQQVLDLIIEGRSSKQIAYMLNLSDKTVANHRLRIIEKTRATNTAELVRIATFVQMCQTLWRDTPGCTPLGKAA